MSWFVVLFFVPVAIFLLIARRVMRAIRRLQDPAQFGQFLSEDARRALRQANYDPDAIRFDEIKESEELSRILSAELRRVFRMAILGMDPSANRRSPGLPGAPSGSSILAPARPEASSEAFDAEKLPPPIYEQSNFRALIQLLLIVAALVAAVLYFVGSIG